MTSSVRHRMISAETVGRDAVLGDLGAIADRVIRGETAIVLLSGEAGVGKTRVVDELVSRVQANGMRVLIGGCVEFGDQEFPLAPLVEMLRRLRTELDETAFDELLGERSRELVRLLPEERSPAASSSRTELGWLMGATLAWLEHLCADGPVGVIVEDLHWSDESTRDLLLYVARALPPRVMLVLTYRSDEMRRRHPLRPMLASLERSVRPVRVAVEPLTEPETGELLAHITGRPVAARLVTDVHRRTEGNPFFIEELAAAPDVDVPESLRDVLLVRADAAGIDAPQLLSIAAVGGSAVDPACLELVSGADSTTLDEVLRNLVDVGLLVRRAGDLRFRHELVREVFADELMRADVTRVHRRYAEFLESNDPTSYGEIARHWYEGGMVERALPASLAAARSAASAGAPGESFGHYERVLDLATRVDGGLAALGLTIEQLMLDAAVQADQARQFARAAELSRRAAHALETTDLQAALMAWVETAKYLAEGRLGGVEIVLTRALDLAPDEPTAGLAHLLAYQALDLTRQGAFGAALDTARAAIATSEAAGELDALALAHSMVAIAGISVNDPTSLESIRHARRAAEASPNRRAATRLLINEAAANLWLARYEENLALCPLAFERSKAEGTAASCGPTALYNLLESQFALGDWDGAAATADQIRRVVGEDDEAGILVWWWPHWPAVLFGRGRREEAADLLDAMAPHDAAAHCREGLGHAVALQLEIAAADDAHDLVADADVALDTLLPDWVEGATRMVATLCRLEADRVLAGGASDADGSGTVGMGARRLLARVKEAVVTSPYDGSFAFPTIPLWLSQADAELSRMAREPATDHWWDLAGRWRKLKMMPQVAYALWRAAEATLIEDAVNGDARRRATEGLREARALAEAMGAEPLVRSVEQLARRARLDLADAPEVHEDPPASDPFGLTEREREVLALVAEGCSNGQIGERLFISTKTASVHVSNILRKLDAANRIEAANIATRHGLAEPVA